MEARSVEQTSVFAAAELFARVEGTLPAPESSHAIKVAIDEALKCKETGEEKTILFGLTGTGYFDMYAYEKFHNGQMSDYVPTDEILLLQDNSLYFGKTSSRELLQDNFFNYKVETIDKTNLIKISYSIGEHHFTKLFRVNFVPKPDNESQKTP
jgi:hypothetical protein